MSADTKHPNESTVLIYGTNLGGYRAAYAIGKSGHKFILLNRGSYVDEMKYQALAQLPLDFCWICGHMPQRAFKANGAMQDSAMSRASSTVRRPFCRTSVFRSWPRTYSITM